MMADLLGAGDIISWTGTFIQPRQIKNKAILTDNEFIRDYWANAYEVVNQANIVIPCFLRRTASLPINMRQKRCLPVFTNTEVIFRAPEMPLTMSSPIAAIAWFPVMRPLSTTKRTARKTCLLSRLLRRPESMNSIRIMLTRPTAAGGGTLSSTIPTSLFLTIRTTNGPISSTRVSRVATG